MKNFNKQKTLSVYFASKHFLSVAYRAAYNAAFDAECSFLFTRCIKTYAAQLAEASERKSNQKEYNNAYNSIKHQAFLAAKKDCRLFYPVPFEYNNIKKNHKYDLTHPKKIDEETSVKGHPISL